MAERVAAFQGVVAARAAAERESKENKSKKEGPAPTTARSTKPAPNGRREVTLHQMMLLDPSLIQYEKG